MNNKEMKKSVFKRLNDSENIRMEEELSRPRVEMWIDEEAAWVASHEAKKYGKRFAHFGVGNH